MSEDIGVIKYLNNMNMESSKNKHIDYVKNNKDDVIFWLDNVESKGEFLFTFDKKKIYNLFADYPHSLTVDEKAIFDKENPYWRDFFSDRN